MLLPSCPKVTKQQSRFPRQSCRVSGVLRPRPQATRSAGQGAQEPLSSSPDAYMIASSRLQALLEEAAWDSRESVRNELGTFSPAMKLTFFTNCGSLLTLLAFGVSIITGEDPLGGATLTSATLDAAWTGLLAAGPLVLASLITRTRFCRSAVPVLEDLHSAQAALLKPILKDLSPGQLLIASSCTVLPGLFLMLPAMHGVASFLGEMARPEVVQPVAAVTVAAATSTSATAADPGLASDVLGLMSSTADSSAIAADAELASGSHAAWGAWQHVSGSMQAGDLQQQVAWQVDGSSDAGTAGLMADLHPDAAADDELGGAAADDDELGQLLFGSSLHRMPLSPPLLLPQGVPDLPTTLMSELMSLLDPSTVILLRGVAHDACGMMPAVLSGFVTAYLVMRQLAPRSSQIWAIRDALSASDRYFRLTMSMSRGVPTTVSFDDQDDPTATATPATSDNVQPSCSSAEASKAVSDAFQRVAVMWLLTRRKVCQMAYMLTATNIVYYALLWQEVGDLAAPATTALVCVMTELILSQREAGVHGSNSTV